MAVEDLMDGDEDCIECGTTMKHISSTPKFVACPNKDCGMYRGVLIAKED